MVVSGDVLDLAISILQGLGLVLSDFRYISVHKQTSILPNSSRVIRSSAQFKEFALGRAPSLPFSN